MDLDDVIRSYGTAVNRLPPSRDRLPARLRKSAKEAIQRFETVFRRSSASPPGSRSLSKLLTRLRDGSRAASEQLKTAFTQPSASPHASSPADDLLALLLTRDEIRRLLKDARPTSIDAITQLATVDEQLKDWAKKRKPGIDRAIMTRFRESVHPTSAEWWWSLDELAKPHALWTLLAGLFFTLSIYFAADTFAILKNVTTSNVTIFGTLAQSVLALLAGSAFTTAGREWLSNVFSTFGYHRRFQGASRMLLALFMFLLILAGRFCLPERASSHFNNEGRDYQKSGLLARSIQSYQQAIALKPDDAEAHFGLALSLDKSREYEKAIEEYKRVMELDPKEPAAVTNRARLYILADNWKAARALLEKLQDRVDELPDDARYYVFKNSGWASLELQQYDQADGELRTALRVLDREELRTRYGAAAHFLLGRTLESLNRLDEARSEWNLFIGLLQQHPEQEGEVEPDWPGYAQMKLMNRTPSGSSQEGVKK